MAQSPDTTDSAATLIPLAELPLTSDEVDRSRLVDFEVDRDGELPLGTQLDWKIRGMMVRGVLRSGDRLPSVRELASFSEINVNTARTVYHGLERDGLSHSERGRGTFVTDGADELRGLDELASMPTHERDGRELDSRNLAAAIYTDPRGRLDDEVSVEPFPQPDPGLDPAALRTELREQISRLEAELAAYAWHDPAAPAPKRARGGEPVGRVIGVEELERTRSELIDRLRRLRGEAEKRGARAEAAMAHVAEMVRDPGAHRWEMVTSEATEDPGCKNWRVVPAWGPVGAIMGWWRVKVSSGCPLAGPLAAVTHQ